MGQGKMSDSDMKTTLLIVLTLAAFVGFGVEIPTLPVSEYADTEVSTNFVVAAGDGGRQRIVFSLELEKLRL